jgi:transcriptional regulator with XRE-family HTH domain
VDIEGGYKMAFRENLAYLRAKAGLSQRELADKLFVSQQMVGAMETGIKTPSMNMLIRLAEVLDCSINDLVCENNNK